MRRGGTRAVAAVLVVPVVAILSGRAAAPDLTPDLAKLASGKFDQVEAGIAEIACSGDPRALPVLKALAGGRLSSAPGGVVVLEAEDGQRT